MFRAQLVLLAVVVAASAFLFGTWAIRSIDAQAQQRSQVLATALAVSGESGIDAAVAAEGVVYAAIYDRDGRLVSTASREGERAPVDPILGSLVARIEADGIFHVNSPLAADTRDVYAPSPAGEGVARVGVHQGIVFVARRRLVFSITLTSLLVFVAAALVATIIKRRFGELEELEAPSALHTRLSDMEDTLTERTAELARQKPRLQSVLDSVDEGVVMIDSVGTVVLSNRRFHELFDVAGSELGGSNYISLIATWKNRVPAAPRLLERAEYFLAHPEEKSVDTFEITVPQHRILQRFSAPVRESLRGEIVGRIETFRDITREAEIDRMKTEFISTVSHELRTPLTAMKGSLGLILAGATGGELSEEATSLLQIARDNTERLIRLINDILDISKIESGGIQIERQEFELADCIRDTVKALEPVANKAGVRFDIELPEDGLPVIADRDRIAQVLTNLVSNAVKFSPKGAKVGVQARTKDRFYRIQVTDEGPGIPDDEIGKLFQKFSQLEGTFAAQKGGTGLGLAISRALVQEHGGDIWVRSAVGKGSTFAFTLPKPGGEESFASILVVNDEPNVTAELRDRLSGVGFAVRTAINEDEALRMASSNPPDIIALGIDMRGFDGFSVAQSLKRDPRTRSIPLFFAAVSPEDRTASTSVNIADWIAKPVDPARLIETLREGISTRAGPTPRVLILDDDPEALEELTGVLSAAGYDVVATTDGSQALAEMNEHRPDAAIVDLVSPGLDAFALIRNLIEHPGTRRVPVVVITPTRLSHDAGEILRKGVFKFLTRSYESTELLFADVIDLIDGILDAGERGTGESAAPAKPA